MTSLLHDMQQLESSLLHTDHREDPAALDTLLAPDFHEVNPLGVRTSRAEVIKWLLRKEPEHRWSFNEWQVDELAPGAVLVRYRAVRTLPPSTGNGARHLSLWKQDGTGQWQLWFHQSTKVA
jgi:hypothetical protein